MTTWWLETLAPWLQSSDGDDAFAAMRAAGATIAGQGVAKP